jgi:hypothetical protein
MRAIIATDFESHLRKVVWITENPGGVSAGICERKPDPHATYHVDGTYHCKIRSKGLDFTAFQEKKCPLAEIQTEQPLLVTGAFYEDDTMRRLPLLSSDPRVDTLLVLGQSVFRDIGCASFSISILHQSCESGFIDGAYSSYEDGSFALVAVHLFPLERFPEQKVGVVIYKGRKSRECI